jgi:hypothetical protein
MVKYMDEFNKLKSQLSLIESAILADSNGSNITGEMAIDIDNIIKLAKSAIVGKDFIELLLHIYLNLLRINAVEQGSEQWLANRCKSVGCSELGDLLNATVASKKMLISSKLGINRMRDGIPQLMWGHAFECTTKTFTEVYFDCKVIDCPGSIRHPNMRVTCSADGIGYARVPLDVIRFLSEKISIKDMEKSRGKLKFNKSLMFSKDTQIYEINKRINNKTLAGKPFGREEILLNYYPIMITLFEFKSPYSRVLTSEIPTNYCCQVQGGLNIFQIASLGFYVECRFVNCYVSQFGYNSNYVNFQGSEFDGEFAITTPLMIGAKFYIMHEHALSYFTDHPLNSDIFITSAWDYQQFGDRLTFSQDYITVDCCFVDDNPIQNAKLLLQFISEMANLLEISIEQREYLTNLYIDAIIDPANIINLMIAVKELNPKRIFAIQLWKLMDFTNAYFNRIGDFLSMFADDVSDVTDSVGMLKAFDTATAEKLIGRIPKAARKNANMSEIISKIIC